MRSLLIILALSALGCGTVFGADAAAGKAVYNRSCRSCHGADGAANPAIAKAMNVEIADLKSASVQSMSDAEIKKIIVDGKGKMHPVRNLSAAQVDDVIAYMRSLK